MEELLKTKSHMVCISLNVILLLDAYSDVNILNQTYEVVLNHTHKIVLFDREGSLYIEIKT